MSILTEHDRVVAKGRRSRDVIILVLTALLIWFGIALVRVENEICAAARHVPAPPRCAAGGA